MDSVKHIFVLDDDATLLDVIDILFTDQYSLTLKLNVDNIIAELHDSKPDLIILDKVLPGTDGCKVCTAIRNDPDFCNIPVIMYSANFSIKDDCLKAGANEFIEKPFELDYLIERVEYHLKKQE